MRSLNNLEIINVSGGADMTIQSIVWVEDEKGKSVPRWTLDGSLTQTVVEGLIIVGYLFNKYYLGGGNSSSAVQCAIQLKECLSNTP